MSELDAWCYDDLEAHCWPTRAWSPSVERDGNVYWTMFDYNPAVFAGRIIAQGWEDFLRDGAPAETGAPAALVEQARAHLLAARKPGRSTHLIVGALGEVRDEPMWLLDNRLFASPYLNGPGTSGAFVDADYVGWRKARGPAWSRVLVTPGRHEIRGTLFVGESVEVRHTVVVAKGQRLELAFAPDARGVWALSSS
jgi:hypothetical protein